MLRHWTVRVDGMIHPGAASDPFLAPLHRSFLISSFASGAAALIVLPLHLALAGPPHAAVLLVLTWMVSQWPLALFLSRSGKLNRAIGLSAGLFACLVATVCLLTGGAASFALVWLLVPLMETAFSTDRRVPVAVTLLCGGLLAAIALLPLPAMQIAVPQGNVPLFTTLGALLYTGVLCFRLTLDRLLARASVRKTQARLDMIAQGSSDVVCALAADGAIRILGGAVSKLVGPLPLAEDEDWLFPRLHVGDRPLYLTHLSDVRHSGETRTFDVRFRVGASRPGEAGQPDYRSLVLTLQAALPKGQAAKDAPLVLTLSDGGLPHGREETAPSVEEGLAGRLTRNDLGQSGDTDQAALRARLADAERPKQVEAMSAEAVKREARTAPNPVAAGSASAIDITACLEQCRDLLAPVASRRGVLLDLSAGADLPEVAANPKSVRQALYFLLADMIETCGEGALLTVTTAVGDAGLDCRLAVRNRSSGLPWCADGSETVFDSAAELLERTGGSLSVRTVPGEGDNVIVHLPLGAQATGAKPLAKTA